MAKAALEAINGFNVYGMQVSEINFALFNDKPTVSVALIAQVN